MADSHMAIGGVVSDSAGTLRVGELSKRRGASSLEGSRGTRDCASSRESTLAGAPCEDLVVICTSQNGVVVRDTHTPNLSV
jgi:hypothetical protein